MVHDNDDDTTEGIGVPRIGRAMRAMHGDAATVDAVVPQIERIMRAVHGDAATVDECVHTAENFDAVNASSINSSLDDSDLAPNTINSSYTEDNWSNTSQPSQTARSAISNDDNYVATLRRPWRTFERTLDLTSDGESINSSSQSFTESDDGSLERHNMAWNNNNLS